MNDIQNDVLDLSRELDSAVGSGGVCNTVTTKMNYNNNNYNDDNDDNDNNYNRSL